MGKPNASRSPRRASKGLDILVRGQKVEVTAALRIDIERRIALALGRFGDQVGRVTVDCSASDDPLNGSGKRCQIAVDLPRVVRVQDTDSDLLTAISRAADRAARSVARALDRERDGQLAYPVAGRRLAR